MKDETVIIDLRAGDGGFNFQLEGETHDIAFLLATTCALNGEFESILKLTVKMLDDDEVMEEVNAYAEEIKTIAAESKNKMN